MGDLENEGENVPPKTTQIEAVTHAMALVDEEVQIWAQVGLEPHAIGMPGLTIISNIQAITQMLYDKGICTEEEYDVMRLTKMLEILQFQRKEQQKAMEAAKRASLGLGPRLVGADGNPILN